MNYINITVFCFLVIFCFHTTLGEEYTVRVRTGQGPGGGTDASFNLTLFGPNNDNITFLLDGKGDALETNNQDEFTYKGKSIYPLDRMVVQRIEKKGWSPDWFVHWITVKVQETLYIFRIGRWILDDNARNIYGTMGQCNAGYQRIQQCVKV